ncbi:hypothetical protein GGF32_005740 [Allomyces javanicus]|nr:hypothetical protein GGF32_005740 [Allomyces javanicus]
MEQFPDESVLCGLYDHFPHSLVTLKLSVFHDARGLPADLGEASGVALVRALAKLTCLTTFHHEFLQFANVAPVLEALAAGQTTPMRSVHLGLLLRDMRSLSPDAVMDPPSMPLAVESLDFRLVWRGRDPFRADETYIKMLSLLPAPTRALHIQIPEWSSKSTIPRSRLLTSPTLQDVQLIATSPRALDPFFFSWFDVTSFARHQIAPTSLVLTRCLPSRLLAKRTDAKWTLPRTITYLDLSNNGLTAGDLAFLLPRLSPNLRHLDLSHNMFHKVITPLPESLRVLKVAHTRTLSDALHPERWILALPLKLRELDVSGCGLSAEI